MAIVSLVHRTADNSHLSPLIKEWVRAVLKLDDSIGITVAEWPHTERGCPSLQTVISIMGKAGVPKRYKVRKAIAEVSLADVEELQNQK